MSLINRIEEYFYAPETISSFTTSLVLGVLGTGVACVTLGVMCHSLSETASGLCILPASMLIGLSVPFIISKIKKNKDQQTMQALVKHQGKK